MIGSPFAAYRRDLPLWRHEAAPVLPWIFALMVYLAGLGAAGLIVLGDALDTAAEGLARSVTVQVPAAASDARMQTIVALQRQTPGIASVRPLEPAETARLLEPWLGSEAKLDILPVPRLADVRLTGDGKLDMPALRRQLEGVVPGAQLEDHRQELARLRAAAHPLEWLLALAIVVALASSAIATVFAVRIGLVVKSSVVELLHLLGADDAEIAGRFAFRWLRLGAVGGAIGAASVLLTLFLMRGAAEVVRLPAPPGNEIADWRLWLVLVGLVAAAGAIAMASARLTVLRRLARMP